MLKAKKLAYDGKGNAVAKTEQGVEEAYTKLGGVDIYAERWAPFTKELAVMVVRSASEVGGCRCFFCVHCFFVFTRRSSRDLGWCGVRCDTIRWMRRRVSGWLRVSRSILLYY